MCDQSRLEKVVSLTPTPPGNNFLREEDLSKSEPTYPLELYFCASCHHVQLGHVVDPRILYQNSYSYVSATSGKFVEHLREYAYDMVQRFALKPGSLVADIGSNDGTCLQFFKQQGMAVLGVDPATEIAGRATAAGIETIGDFFSLDLAVRLREQYGAAAYITSHNACAHIDNLDDVIQGVRHWLADDGVFVFEVGYLLDVYENVWFDTIYHEHLDYHTVAPLRELLARGGMELFGVQRVSPQGGSIRVFTQRAGGPHRQDGSVEALVALEMSAVLDKPETFVEFGRRIDQVGVRLRSMLREVRSGGSRVAGFGAPTKATTLLSHFGITKNELDFIVDDNPLKQGLFSPMSHIPVEAPGELYARRPEYVLILAWNFAEPIMAAHRKYAEEGGRFMVPMPVPRIMES